MNPYFSDAMGRIDMKIKTIFVGLVVALSLPLACMAQMNAPLSEDPDFAVPDTVRVESAAPVVPQTARTGPAALASAPSPTMIPKTHVGDATRNLMALQAESARPGTPHQVLGATAGLTWQRYLDSFTHPIPEAFEVEVESSGTR